MCVKLPLEDLNPDRCPPHPISIYTCGVTTAPRVCGGYLSTFELCIHIALVKIAINANFVKLFQKRVTSKMFPLIVFFFFNKTNRPLFHFSPSQNNFYYLKY